MGNVLVVSPTPFLPESAGNRARVATLLRMLSIIGHQVYFAHVEREPGDTQSMKSMLGDRFFSLPYNAPRRQWVRARRWLQRLGVHRAYAIDIDAWYDPDLEPLITDIVSAHQIDVVLVEYAYMSKIIEALPGNVRTIIDTHDVFANRHLRYLDEGLRPMWFSCTEADEVKALNRADLVIAIQSQEAEYFSERLDTQVMTVGHMAEIAPVAREHLSCISDESRRFTVVYVGSNNPINVASIRWFCDAVMPILREQIDVRFVVAGTICDALAAEPGIELLGQLPNLRPLYETASAVVNPARLGTGLKIKTIEALGMGLPLVTTSVGAEGLLDGAGSAYLLADSAQEFAAQVLGLGCEPKLRDRLSRGAIKYAQNYNTANLSRLAQALTGVKGR